MGTISARNVAEVLERIAPADAGVPGDRPAFLFGDPKTEVRGVGCMWIAHSASIRAAAERGLNLLIVHEGLFMRPQCSPWYRGPSREADVVGNRKRRALLTRHRMVVYRCHSPWDALPEDGVADQAVAALGIRGLEVRAAQKFFKVHELPRPESVAALARRTGRKLGVPGVRVFGDGRRRIRRFAFLIGGFGENQTHIPQAAMELGAECVIIGEMSEFIVIGALECGLPVIETLHSRSEIPAIKRQAELLGARLPGVRVEYIDSGALAFEDPARKRKA